MSADARILPAGGLAGDALPEAGAGSGPSPVLEVAEVTKVYPG
jgi:hypothetical protein